MKKLVSIGLTLIFVLALCACGAPDNPADPTSVGTVSSEQVSDQNTTPETTIPAETDPTVPELLARDYLKTIHYISDEWMNGVYLVYGTDRSQNGCYGLLYASGNFEPLTEYGAYYPLAGGNLLVSNDEKVIRDFSHSSLDSRYKPLCVNGKIIDHAGSILYEPDPNGPYQKMYIVNSHTIFVLAVSTGFDGMDVYWGVLDNTGKWIHELDNTGILVEKIKENKLVEVNEDGSWSYAYDEMEIALNEETGQYQWDNRMLYTARCGGYDGKENDSLAFYLVSGLVNPYDPEKETTNCDVVIYQASSNQLVAPLSYPLRGSNPTIFGQVSQDLWSMFSGGSNVTQWDDLFNAEGEKSEIVNYLFTVDGIKYWQGGNIYKRNGILYSDEYPDGIIYPENIADKILKFVAVKDGNVYMTLEGADELSYLAVGDLQGNIVEEPYRPANFVSYIRGIADDGSAAYISDKNLYIINLFDPAEQAREIAIGDKRIDYVKFLGNDLIAVSENNTSEEDEAWIYSFDGDRIS